LIGASGERREPGVDETEYVAQAFELPAFGHRHALADIGRVAMPALVAPEILRAPCFQPVFAQIPAPGKRVLAGRRANQKLGFAEGEPKRGLVA
jgi:hypothetical protein